MKIDCEVSVPSLCSESRAPPAESPKTPLRLAPTYRVRSVCSQLDSEPSRHPPRALNPRQPLSDTTGPLRTPCDSRREGLGHGAEPLPASGAAPLLGALHALRGALSQVAQKEALQALLVDAAGLAFFSVPSLLATIPDQPPPCRLLRLPRLCRVATSICPTARESPLLLLGLCRRRAAARCRRRPGRRSRSPPRRPCGRGGGEELSGAGNLKQQPDRTRAPSNKSCVHARSVELQYTARRPSSTDRGYRLRTLEVYRVKGCCLGLPMMRLEPSLCAKQEEPRCTVPIRGIRKEATLDLLSVTHR